MTHQWMIILHTPLTEEQAKIIADDKTPSVVSEWNITTTSIMGPGCAICHQEYKDAHDKPCPGADNLLPFVLPADTGK